MNRGNIWITIGIIFALCLCHSLVVGYPVKSLSTTIKKTIDRRTITVKSPPLAFSHNSQLWATTRILRYKHTLIELRSFKDSSIIRTLEVFSDVGHIVFSPDDFFVAASTGNSISIWRTDSGQLVHELPITSPYDSAYDIDFSADGKKLISRLKTQLVAWDVVSGQHLYSLDVQDRNLSFALESVSVSPGGKFFAVGSYRDYVKLYRLENGTLLRQLSLTGVPQFISDDKILIITLSGRSGYRVLLYKIESDTASAQLFGLDADSLRSWVASPDGRFLTATYSKGDGGDFFVAAPRVQKRQDVLLWQIDAPYPLTARKLLAKRGDKLRSLPVIFTLDSKFLSVGGDLWRLPLVHPWLANALLVVGVSVVIFFADRFPRIS